MYTIHCSYAVITQILSGVVKTTEVRILHSVVTLFIRTLYIASPALHDNKNRKLPKLTRISCRSEKAGDLMQKREIGRFSKKSGDLPLKSGGLAGL